MKRIEIFRVGRHTDMRGQTIEFTARDLAASAAAYDPRLHEAPIVVGHPQADAPAYGWVKSLSFGEALEAEPAQVDAAFSAMVSDGRFKKVSASFYLPDSAANPSPGTYYLKHVGFLGAAAPAVRGLRQVEFAGGEDDAVTLEFSEWGDRTSARVFRSLRDWLIGKFGQDEADKAMPSWDVDAVQEDAVSPAADTGFTAPDGADAVVDRETPEAPDQGDQSPPAEYSADPPDGGDVPDEEKEAALTNRERELAQREAAFAEREAQARKDGDAEFLDRLLKDGRPLPCDRGLVLAFMRRLDGEDSVSFGENESRSALELFKAEFLARLPRQVDFAERAPSDGAEFDDENPSVVAAAAAEYAAEQSAKGILVTAWDAVRHVKKGR